MSKTLSSLGGLVGRRPFLSILIVLMITGLSIFSVAYNGMNSSFDNSDFMPENEITLASDEISETFAADYSLTVLLKGADDDLITQQGFLDVLEAEAAVMGNTSLASYLSTADSNPYSSVISPVDIISSAILMSQNETTLAYLGLTPVPTYDNLIGIINVTPTYMLKGAVQMLMASPSTPEQVKTFLPRLLTKDFDPNASAPSAKGALVIYSFNKELVGTEIPELELERAVHDEMQGGEDASIFVIGMAMISDEINTAANDSISNLFPVAIIAIIIILAFIYRDVIDTVIGLVGLVLAIIWMYGFGTAVGYSFNPMTMVVPILILGLGIDYSIHLVMRYREERGDGESPEEATRKTMISVGEALVLATVTTVIAFLSNITSSMGAIAQFGILAAVGIVSSFIVMIMLVPAVKVLRDRRNEKKGKVSKHYAKRDETKVSLSKFNRSVGRLTHKAPWAVVAVALVITAGAGVGALSVNTTFNLNDFLPGSMEISKNIEFLTNEFASTGGATVSVLVKGDLTDPASIRAVETSLDSMYFVDNVLQSGITADVDSFLSVMYDYAIDSTGPGYTDPNYNATFAAMYAGSFDIEPGVASIKDGATQEDIAMLFNWLYVNAPASMAQVIMPVADADHPFTAVLIVYTASNMLSEEVLQLNDDLIDAVQPIKDQGMVAVVTGDVILTEQIMGELNASQSQSLITTLIASLIILTLVFWFLRRSLFLGTLATIPVALCVVWMWGTMYIAGIPMNVMTLMIASLTVGMGVTYGIHVTHRFVEEIHEHEDIELAVDNAVGRTGVSLLGAALTTVVGFGIIGFSLLPPIQEFGMITAIAIGYSFIGSVFVLPAFLVIWARSRAKRKAD